MFESKPDQTIMMAFAKKFGYGDQLVGKQADGTTKIKVIKDKDGWDEPEPESILREINRGMWTIGYTGQSPERLKLHMKNQATFDVKTLARQGRTLRRRLLRSAVALLRHAGDQASGLAEPVRRVALDDGRRRLLPRQFRRRARRRQPAGRGRLVSEGLRAHHRLSGVRPRADEEARLVGRADRRRKEGGRRQELEDRSVGRHPARDDEARRALLGQRQGARDRLELPRRHPAASRAAVLAASGPGREISDARRQEGVLATADPVQVGAAGQRQEGSRQELSADADLAAGWSSTKAVARRPGRTPGSPSCSRKTSSRSTRRTPTTAASRTANTCG